MEISFATEALKEACLARKQDANQLPMEVSKAVHALYNALRGADHVEELPWGGPMSKENDAWSADLVSGYKLSLRAAHSKLPRNGGRINWSRVYRVQVVSIEGPDA